MILACTIFQFNDNNTSRYLHKWPSTRLPISLCSNLQVHGKSLCVWVLEFVEELHLSINCTVETKIFKILKSKKIIYILTVEAFGLYFSSQLLFSLPFVFRWQKITCPQVFKILLFRLTQRCEPTIKQTSKIFMKSISLETHASEIGPQGYPDTQLFPPTKKVPYHLVCFTLLFWHLDLAKMQAP